MTTPATPPMTPEQIEEGERRLAHWRASDKTKWLSEEGLPLIDWLFDNASALLFTARSHHRLAERLAAAERTLRKAEQLADVAMDWNLPEVEIDGAMVRTLDLRNEFAAALTAHDATREGGG